MIHFDLSKALLCYIKITRRDRNHLRDLLSRAINAERYESISVLLQQGLVLDRTTAYLDRPAALGKVDLVALLLEKGANVNAKADDDGDTPLFGAISGGHHDVVALLIQKGALVNLFRVASRSNNGSTILESTTPLMLAVRENKLQIANLLLKAGAKPELHGFGAVTPLLYAAEQGSVALVKLLLENGANPNTEAHHKYGHTALIAAVRCKTFESVELLIQHDAKPDVADLYGRTPLSHAAEGGCARIVALLLSKGVTVDSECFSGGTQLVSKMRGRYIRPLDIAKVFGHKEVIKMLKESGSKDDVDDVQFCDRYRQLNVLGMLHDS